jgi:multiple antibiotic resistance protein
LRDQNAPKCKLMFNFKEIVSVTLILFSVIDVLGSLPVIVDFRRKLGKIESEKTTIVAGLIMVIFLFLGERLLSLFGVDIASFAIAGAIILFLLGLEMILGREIFKHGNMDVSVASIVPIAFPMIAGAATMTTLLSLRSAYQIQNILVGIMLNLFFIYLVLKSSNWLERKLGQGGTDILRKVFGIILLAIAIKLFKTNLSM